MFTATPPALMNRRTTTLLPTLLLTILLTPSQTAVQPGSQTTYALAQTRAQRDGLRTTNRELEFVDIVAKRREECQQCYKEGLRNDCLQMIETCEEWYFATSSSARSNLLDRAERLHDSIRAADAPGPTMICKGFKFLLVEPAQTCDLDIGDVWDLLSAGLALDLMLVLKDDAHLQGLFCGGWDIDHDGSPTARGLKRVSVRNFLRPYATSITLHSRTSSRTSVLRNAVRKLMGTLTWKSVFSVNMKLMRFARRGKNTYIIYVPFREKFSNELPSH